MRKHRNNAIRCVCVGAERDGEVMQLHSRDGKIRLLNQLKLGLELLVEATRVSDASLRLAISCGI